VAASQPLLSVNWDFLDRSVALASGNFDFAISTFQPVATLTAPTTPIFSTILKQYVDYGITIKVRTQNLLASSPVAATMANFNSKFPTAAVASTNPNSFSMQNVDVSVYLPVWGGAGRQWQVTVTIPQMQLSNSDLEMNLSAVNFHFVGPLSGQSLTSFTWTASGTVELQFFSNDVIQNIANAVTSVTSSVPTLTGSNVCSFAIRASTLTTAATTTDALAQTPAAAVSIFKGVISIQSTPTYQFVFSGALGDLQCPFGVNWFALQQLSLQIVVSPASTPVTSTSKLPFSVTFSAMAKFTLTSFDNVVLIPVTVTVARSTDSTNKGNSAQLPSLQNIKFKVAASSVLLQSIDASLPAKIGLIAPGLSADIVVLNYVETAFTKAGYNGGQPMTISPGINIFFQVSAASASSILGGSFNNIFENIQSSTGTLISIRGHLPFVMNGTFILFYAHTIQKSIKQSINQAK
jgi:hypothetical protein